MPERSSVARRRRIAWIAAIASLAVLDQALQFGALRGGTFFGMRVAPFDPPIFTDEQRESLDRVSRHLATGNPPLAALDFDAELGWGPPKTVVDPRYVYDWSGCRIGKRELARSKSSGVKRIATFGCSFTQGFEVDGDRCWSSLVDERFESLEFANAGVAGYGSDQAWLRWKKIGASLDADEVWLGFLPESIARLSTVYWPALSHYTPNVAYKPRFEFGAKGELELVACPARSLDDLVSLTTSQSRWLAAVGPHDAWVERSPLAYAPFGSSLLHRSGFARLALTALERRGRRADDFLLDETSEPHRLARAIAREMNREVRASGARFRVIVLADRAELEDLGAKGRASWRTLVDGWRADGVEVFDTSSAALAAGMQRDARFWAPGGHYSAEGNRVIAEALEAELLRETPNLR